MYIMAKTISMTHEELQSLIRQGIAEAMQAERAQLAKEAASRPEGKSVQSQRNEEQCIIAFRRLGYGDVVPNVDVFTYNRWIAAGFKVKRGETAVKVKNLRLFHKSQVEKISPEEVKAIQEERQASFAQHQQRKAERRQEQVA